MIQIQTHLMNLIIKNLMDLIMKNLTINFVNDKSNGYNLILIKSLIVYADHALLNFCLYQSSINSMNLIVYN